MTDPQELARVRETGIVAVLRAPSADAAVSTVEALVRGGITGIEVTYTTPDAAAAIAEVHARHGDTIHLGAGTIIEPSQAREAVDAGARFLVSPGTQVELAQSMRATGAAVFFGALTPSEVMTALALGTDAVKLFPASLGGPAYVRSLRGPFPDVPFVPTGGVSADNLAEWFAAGVIAVGAGSELCSPVAIRAGDWDAIEASARRFSAALAAVRDTAGV